MLVYCDGSCEGSGNEAVGKYGYVIYNGNRQIAEGGGIAGHGIEITVNVAEYVAVLRALEWLRDAGYEGQAIRVRSDSRLVMQQLGMLCAVRSKRLLPWWRAVRALAREFGTHFEWVPRSWNREADEWIRQETLKRF